VRVVKEGGEPALFKQAFHMWNAPAAKPISSPLSATKSGGARTTPDRVAAEIDVSALALPFPRLRCVLYKSFSPIARFQHLIAPPFN
jgi:hypothetical protein